MKNKLINTVSLGLGLSLVVGLMSMNGSSRAIASIPSSGQSAGKITDDTLIYDNLREISVKKEREVNFDNDLSRLSAMEKHYKERQLPKKARLISYKSVSRKQGK